MGRLWLMVKIGVVRVQLFMQVVVLLGRRSLVD